MTDPMLSFPRSPRWTAALQPCTDHFGQGDPGVYDWPNNVLSARTVVYESGVITRAADTVEHRVDPEELARCRRLADSLAAIVGEHPVGMRSESDTPWVAYFRVANLDQAPVAVPDEAWVREVLFGGTICPLDPVVVEPFAESSEFWGYACQGALASTVALWTRLAEHLRGTPELHTPSFVSVGFYEYAPALRIPRAEQPAGFVMRGSCLPRVALAFTDAGSVVGLLGHVVWT